MRHATIYTLSGKVLESVALEASPLQLVGRHTGEGGEAVEVLAM
jgi:hypothetical protein